MKIKHTKMDSSLNRLKNSFNIPLALLMLFPFYFAYDLYTGNVFFSHNDYAGMYYPFRQWFLNRLLDFEFPLWNPYWGLGHEAVIWATVPIDPYTILELILGPQYHYFYLIQCIAMVLAGYIVVRKFGFEPRTAALGSLFFFMSPLVTYWYVQFIKVNFFIGHMFAFFFLVKWFETGKLRYPILLGWAFFFSMFGTKLEYWFFGSVFFILSPVLAWFIVKPRKMSMIFTVWAAIGIAIAAQSWQINLLVNALKNSGRNPAGDLLNLFAPEMYQNLFLSLGDSDLFPLLLICTPLIFGLRKNAKYPYHLFMSSILLALLLQCWKFAFLPTFLQSPVLYGAVVASILAFKNQNKREFISTWVFFMLPAYYWCRPLVNADETYLLSVAPFMFKAAWGFLVWMGCAQLYRSTTVKLAYVSVIMVLILEVQGQIILSYLFGFLWIPGRDNYLLDFAFAILVIFGTRTEFLFKPLMLRLTPFVIAFAAYPNLYYMLPSEPVPNYANQLLTKGLPYNPFTGVPNLKKVVDSFAPLPYRRVLDPDIEQQIPQNHGTFLLTQTGNATFYGSMTPMRYNELINYYRYGILPKDGVSGYPSVYSELTISRLPKLNSQGLSNKQIYRANVWTIPPLEPGLLRMLGISHVISRNHLQVTSLPSETKKSLSSRLAITKRPDSLSRVFLMSNVMKKLSSSEFTIAKLPDSLPRAFLVSNVNKNNLDEFGTDMKPDIILEGNRQSIGANAFIAKPAVILEYKPEYVEVEADSSGGGYLVLSDVFHPYWSAVVDGKAAEIVPAFHAFRAVKIPSGKHKVEFICKVPYFKGAFFISILLVVIYFSLTLFSWHKKVVFPPESR